MKILILTLLTTLSFSCKSQEQKAENLKNENPSEQKDAAQIGEYVVETFQDSKGNIWFGTLNEGATKYDGNKLVYLTTKDGLPSNRIVQIIEDNSGHLWFGTGEGISRYDGKTFTNYSEKDGLCSNMVSNLLIDSKGTFWIGTWGGVARMETESGLIKQIPLNFVSGHNLVQYVLADKNNRLWVATWLGLYLFDNSGGLIKHWRKGNGFHDLPHEQCNSYDNSFSPIDFHDCVF
jgi:ligand-binding sensor domain-containing protein